MPGSFRLGKNEVLPLMVAWDVNQIPVIYAGGHWWLALFQSGCVGAPGGRTKHA